MNRTDILKEEKKTFYRLIRKLTCGYIDGQKQIQKEDSTDKDPKKGLDSYLKRKIKVLFKIT